MTVTRRDFIKQVAAGATTLMASTVLANLSVPGKAKALDGTPKNLFIMGWDGAGLNNVLPMLNDGTLPNLKRFIETLGGNLCPIQLTGYTVTVASWSQVFTGLTHDQTGILGTFRHDLSTGLVMCREPMPFYPVYNNWLQVYRDNSVWYQEIPYSQSILKPIKRLGYKVGFYVSKKFLANEEGHPFRAIGTAIDRCGLYDPILDPDLPITETRIDDNYLFSLRNRAFDFMDETEKHLTFLHLDPDIYGHRYGEPSKQYRQEFVRCDRVLGQLLDRVDPETTNVMVITDHGFDPGKFGHLNAPDAWLATDLPIHPVFVHQDGQKAFGTMRDVAHTILDHFGIPLSTMPLQMRGVSMLV